MPNPLLTRRAVILAKPEVVFNQDSVPIPGSDAILVAEPDYTIDPNVLERDFVRNDLSPQGVRIGRKLAGLSFTVELRSNGKTNSGLIADAAKMGTLLRGCGYSETAITGTGTVGDINKNDGQVGPNVGWTAGGASTLLSPVRYTVTVVLGGASGVASVRATANTTEDVNLLDSEVFSASTDSVAGTIVVNSTDPLSVLYTVGGTWVTGDILTLVVGGIVVTATVGGTTTLAAVSALVQTAIDAINTDVTSTDDLVDTNTVTFANDFGGTVITTDVTAMTLGNSGGTIIPSWTGTLVIGDSWEIWVFPVGIQYQPVSTNFESLTLYAYFDGLRHILTGCFGTFTINAEAGTFGTVSFQFTGQYVAPLDIPIPTNASFEQQIPAQIELAKLRFDNFDAVVNAWTFDQNNNIVPRPDVNSADGFNGTRITGRDPQGGFDPEATLIADYDWWNKMAQSPQVPFEMRVGQTAGNIVWFFASKVQLSGLTYQSRDDLRVFDASMRFTRFAGNDELFIHFA